MLSASTRDNLCLDAAVSSWSQAQAVLALLGLQDLAEDEWLGRGGRSLSGGEQKRLGLARAVLQPKSLILLDEPFEALDEANVAKVVAAINALAAQCMVVVASHIQPQSLDVQQVLEWMPPTEFSSHRTFRRFSGKMAATMLR